MMTSEIMGGKALLKSINCEKVLLAHISIKKTHTDGQIESTPMFYLI
jgi:hypothetical protein